MQETTNSLITIVPPICAAKGERHPQWVALTLPVELAHCEGDIEDISEADRTQFNIYQVIRNAAEGIDNMAETKEAQFWPTGALTMAATCFLMADAAQQVTARLEKILEG